MSPRRRMALAVLGLLIFALSLSALAYALWPTERQQEQFRPAPTLFVPPLSAVVWPRLG